MAFGAGLLSFLSPCVLPLVPGYIASVSGVTEISEIKARRVIGPSLAFVGSFSAVFIAFGLLGQQALRGTLTGPTAQHVCGLIIIAMGLLFVLSPFVPMLGRDWHISALMNRAGRSGPVLTGIAFAVAWTPCTSTTLGAIISATSSSSSTAQGAFLLVIYCTGLGVPFLITALAFGKVTAALTVVKRHYPIVIGTGGVVLVSMGVLILTGHFTYLNAHVNNALHTFGVPNLSGTS